MYALAFKLALRHLTQKPISRIIVVMSVACILLMNAMVYLLFQGFSKSLVEARASHFMTAYLDSSIPPTRENEVLSAVKKVPGVASAQLVSKDAFLENFSRYFPQLTGELANLDVDTIPRYVKVKVINDSATDKSKDVITKIEKLKGIELVEQNKHRFAGLIQTLSTLRTLALVLLCGMSIALLCILLNHFKLGTAFQNQVRNTLNVLGASKSHIFIPFAVEGLIEGGLGGAIAAIALLAYGRVFEAQLNGMFSAMGYQPYHFQLGQIALMLAAVGMISGMIGSLWAAVRVSRVWPKAGCA